MKLLDNQVAIITGSGRGIGAAAARLFAQHGARVVVTDIDEAPAKATAEAIHQAGGEALVIPADVTKPADIEELIGQTVSTYGSIDILVNNAGYTWDGMAHKMSDEQWEAILAIHLTAPFRLIRACAPYMREAAKQEKASGQTPKARKIINVSSTSGTRGNVGQANYSAGKAGIIGLTKTMAKEWGQFNIQVNAVAFGYIETRLTQSKEQGETTEREGKTIPLGIPDHLRQMATMLIPMGRPGTPEEAAGALLFFASPLSNYVSGQVLEVTGGM
ncbi:MAG: SDR family oxidoreductase [Chloroflexi bacterium]|nr:MAG: SDR family oxidoreductase [Chloroflexota bacterium]